MSMVGRLDYSLRASEHAEDEHPLSCHPAVLRQRVRNASIAVEFCKACGADDAPAAPSLLLFNSCGPDPKGQAEPLRRVNRVDEGSNRT